MSGREERVSDAELAALAALEATASPAPWRASVEGRDHTSGDDVILVGEPREADMYVTRDDGPASSADLDFIAAARNHVPALVAEAQRTRWANSLLRASCGQGEKQPFLVVDDYGTGGIWMYVYARSADEISVRFPGLIVITEWRDWMTPDRLIPIIASIGPDLVFDIDEPDGYLAKRAPPPEEAGG